MTTIAGTGWTVTIDETSGAYTFTQTAPYAHDTGAASDSAVVTVTITDSDGAETVNLGSGSTKYRHVLLWFTAPPAEGSTVRISELKLLG